MFYKSLARKVYYALLAICDTSNVDGVGYHINVSSDNYKNKFYDTEFYPN